MDQEFGPRLRRERERRKISLDSIAATTKVSIALFQGLERDDVSRWPSGIFRRSFVRAYAAAIGLDPEETVREFVERFPDPETGPWQADPVAPAAPHPGDTLLCVKVPHTRATDALVRWGTALAAWWNRGRESVTSA